MKKSLFGTLLRVAAPDLERRPNATEVLAKIAGCILACGELVGSFR